MNQFFPRYAILLAIIAAFAAGRLGSVEIPDPPRTASAPVAEEYCVLDTKSVPVANAHDAAATLGRILNQRAAQGWKVSAVMDSFVILVRQ